MTTKAISPTAYIKYLKPAPSEITPFLNCLRNEKVISTKSIKLIRMLYLVDISKLNKLDISKDVLKELEEFTEDYYDRYSGIYLKSKILLDTIK